MIEYLHSRQHFPRKWGDMEWHLLGKIPSLTELLEFDSSFYIKSCDILINGVPWGYRRKPNVSTKKIVKYQLDKVRISWVYLASAQLLDMDVAGRPTQTVTTSFSKDHSEFPRARSGWFSFSLRTGKLYQPKTFSSSEPTEQLLQLCNNGVDAI